MSNPAEIPVWDPFVRIFHWTLAIAFILAYATEDEWLGLHLWAGYLTLGLIVLRTVWGFVGTRHARFRDFVVSPARILEYLKQVAGFRAPRFLGHNPAGGAMVVTLMLCVLVTGLTGLVLHGALYPMGPFDALTTSLGIRAEGGAEALEEVHEFFANLTLVLVAVHLAGVLFESWVHRENLVRSMITGRKRP
jgi:cytochrome b